MKRRNDVWLMEPDALSEYMAAEQARNGDSTARRYSLAVAEGYAPAAYAINGDHGILAIHAPLVCDPSWDGYDYQTLSLALEQMAANRDVEYIVLDINSPGGDMRGLFAFCEEIKKCGKPVYAYTSGMTASAAYAVACSCRKVYASESALIGSIGAVIQWVDYSKWFEKQGIKENSIYAKYSDRKNLDPSTPEGRADCQRRVDKAEDLLHRHIAECRGMTPEAVRDTFGHGAVFYASEAPENMIDGTFPNMDACIRAINKPSQTEGDGGESMTKDELKEKNPDVYAAIVQEAKEAALAEAKARYEARLKGETDKAVKAELDRRAGLEKFSAVDDPEVKAMVAKAIEEGKSVEAFSAEIALKLVEISGKAKARVPAEDGELEAEAVESAKAAPKVGAEPPMDDSPVARAKRDAEAVLAAMDKAKEAE